MTWQAVLYFLFWAGLFALMMRFGCGSHVMGHGHGHGSEDHSDSEHGGSTAAGQAIDPVCGKTVSTGEGKSAVYAGRPYYFCSSACREKFEADPDRYVRTSAGAAQKEHHHGCC